MLQVIAFAERDQEDRLDPMIYIFPRMTKCTFHKFGSSGEVNSMRIMMTMMMFCTSGRVNDVCLKLCAFKLDASCPCQQKHDDRLLFAICPFSDQVEKHDALCILPLNIVNEKIYIFLWFWLLLLGCLSTLVVAYRLGQMSCNKCSL